MIPMFTVTVVRLLVASGADAAAASGSPDDEAFGEGHAGQRAELRVAALDQLLKRGRRQPRGHRVGAGRRELRHVARQRARAWCRSASLTSTTNDGAA